VRRRGCKCGFALLASLCLTAPVAAQATEPAAYAGSLTACLATHGDRDQYKAGLLQAGWTEVDESGRALAIAKLVDAYLPSIVASDGTWAGLLAKRDAAVAFWDSMAANRAILAREDRVLLLAGFRDDTGEMRVECWSAGPADPATDDFFGLVGMVWQSEGVTMTQVNIAATDDGPPTEVYVSRLTPPEGTEAALTATDGLRTRVTFSMTGGAL
jgi:hypothetical protein